MVIDKEWNDMTAADVANTLLDDKKRDEFIVRIMGLAYDDGADWNDAIDEITTRIDPVSMDTATAQDYERFMRVIDEFEKYIDHDDWRPGKDGFRMDWYSYAFYGIRGYIEQHGLTKRI